MNRLSIFKRRETKRSIIRSVQIFAASNVGNIRKHNEDNYYLDSIGIRDNLNTARRSVLITDERLIFAVCDGMGGEAHGDEASYISVFALAESAHRIKAAAIPELHHAVNQYVSMANNQICKMVEYKKCGRSGSTLAMVCLDGTNIYPFNIGDSRVYHLHNSIFTQITEDQTLAIKKLKANIYTEEEARNSKDAHKITSFIGADTRNIGLHSLAYAPVSSDHSIILLCSDGLTDMCSDSEIKYILERDMWNPAEALVNRALKNGGTDNVTCIVLHINSFS